ncbi:MAG: type II secretion system protein N [Mizugakiibacter sp.]|uniref:type II secretion system protein N n=1 Tax=Mizugakiibacter sp. TaxID=1972610 RepID=UPI0031C173A5|nr:type II secretion system protein N [Xanthomonadaceae bacterium]
MTRSRIALVGLAVLLLALAALLCCLPARLALRLAGERLGPLRLEGASGSLWRGRAVQAWWGPRALGALDWTLARGPLLAGRVESTFALRAADGFTLGGAAAREGERIDLREVTLDLPAARLAPLLDDDPLPVRGAIRGRIGAARLVRGWPTRLDAQFVWRDAALGADAVRLGDVAIVTAVQPDGSIGGTLRNGGGEVAVDGRYRVLPLGWTLQAKLAPRTDDARVRRALARFGKPAADGSVSLRIRHGVVW